MRIILETRPDTKIPVDLNLVGMDSITHQSTQEIAHLKVNIESQLANLGDVFTLTCQPASDDEVVLAGMTSLVHQAGQQMNMGKLIIDGNAGCYIGQEMSGGQIEIRGNAGDCLGIAMTGGLISVSGNTGDWCGAAKAGYKKGMEGGTILIKGNSGKETGAAMCRGLIAIGGDCGPYAGARMNAGTILCPGNLGEHAGVGMKRGSLIAGCSPSLLPGFKPAGYADPNWLHIYLNWLISVSFPVPPSWWQKNILRHTGDHLVSGKGEILVYEFNE
jgi:formylmethanofuran dehydrogenase subunit C